MSHKRSGSKFSFTKFFDAVVPNLFDDVSVVKVAAQVPLRKDMVYSRQLAAQNFYALDENSFYAAGVVDNERTSKNVHKALLKYEIIKADGMVDTTQIGPKFLHQLRFIDAYRQRELVNLLFWWAEECQRYAKLIGEDTELTALIAEAELHAAEDAEDITRKERLDQVKFARERVRMKIRQRPTQRRPNTEANTDDIMERFKGPPPMVAGANNEARVPDEPLPSYGMVASK